MQCLTASTPTMSELITSNLAEYDHSGLANLTYQFLEEVEDWFSSFDQEGYCSHWYLFRKAWLGAMTDGYVKLLISGSGRVGDIHADKHRTTATIYVDGSLLDSELEVSLNRDHFELCNRISRFCNKKTQQGRKLEANPIWEMTLSYKKLKPLNDYYAMKEIIFDYIEQCLSNLAEEGYCKWGTVELTLFDSRCHPAKVGNLVTYVL